MSADPALSTTERTTLHRLSERGRADRADLYAVLDAGLICHLGVVVDGFPVAMIFGTARQVTGDAHRLAALRAITEQLVPGQWEHVRQPTSKELAATMVLELPLAEASVKVRTGPPHDEPEDYGTDTWAGVLPAQLIFGAAEPDPELRAGVPTPEHIKVLAGRARGA